MTVSQVASLLQSRDPVRVTNAAGRSRYVIVCEHASNWLPPSFGLLGLVASDMKRHIAWDPGALPVAEMLAAALDAPLVESCVSRLAIDCNRPVDAPDLVPALSETTLIPGNVDLSDADLALRISLSHAPFHEALAALVDSRGDFGLPSWIVTIHSFTPVYKGAARPWQIGIIHDDDDRLARPLLDGLRRLEGVVAAANEPYSPADRVYYTLERHARPRGLPCAMVEIRNDEVADLSSQMRWAGTLASILSGIQEPDLHVGAESASNAKGLRARA